ncbi:hypothetical protein [Bradyrhizobium neotropicale]|uniref:hypothetical protein n=1 Tax=Bradyrhizobium neotropicale TaxID=1497615 RepID=UPI001AD7A4A2|nr:hypothetical protein [Bradyrhizobium neotropicale]MBO4221963.1 hypothetical protein [Bradyrhizobium neotropicale]
MTDQNDAAKQAEAKQKEHEAATRKRLTEEREVREKARTARMAEAVKPTPTQEENDLAASGVPVLEHEDDGSGPDPPSQPQDKQHQTREARPAASPSRSSYTTRQSSTSE